MRGKPFVVVSKSATYRITPAGAGKTNFFLFERKKTGDHPRRCGENNMRLLMLSNLIGSPPQVRGKLIVSGATSVGHRITPAGAGKTM